MVFLVQLKDSPSRLMIIRATSRLDAFTFAKIMDTPKKVWLLENFIPRAMGKSIQVIDLK